MMETKRVVITALFTLLIGMQIQLALLGKGSVLIILFQVGLLASTWATWRRQDRSRPKPVQLETELGDFLTWLAKKYPGTLESNTLPSGRRVFGKGMQHLDRLTGEYMESRTAVDDAGTMTL